MLADTVDSDEQVKIPPEPQDPNVQPLPEENEKYQETRSTFSTSVMCERQVSIRLSWSFAVSVTILLSRGLQHFPFPEPYVCKWLCSISSLER
jgi:hypothetical protein